MKWNDFKAIIEDALGGQNPDIDIIDIKNPNLDEECLIDIYDHKGRLCIYGREAE